jgi:hypothetical protein
LTVDVLFDVRLFRTGRVRTSFSIIRPKDFSMSDGVAIMTGAVAPPETMAA